METRHLPSLDDLHRQLDRVMLRDRHRLGRELQQIRQSQQRGKPHDRPLQRLVQRVAASLEQRNWREQNRPAFDYPQQLPITSKRQQIAEAMQQNPVVIVCGETGSGKSTQLPKICLDAGRGIGGAIGHTQPRRIAARSIAARLAEELNTTVGAKVGFKIRFADETGPETFVKLMTDGILLAETQHDRFLDQYDTIIVDEAHERSLNIDFLLGYLKQQQVKRPDLRLIITSATIDAERFAQHFGGPAGPAPVLEVSGRTYPVEVRYRPMEEDEQSEQPTLPHAVGDAISELCREGPGDILVFLPTERDIRDVTKSLRGRFLNQAVELLPLYARLSTAEQNRVFQPHPGRRIVLATNVAESSLTVPNIRYVVDTGTVRISRYSPRLKVQRLPIEPVSKASGEQRKGRCGRIGPGICIRLYSEGDWLARDAYTTPEIRRTNLAAVILQMLSLKLGEVDQFPFLDPPRPEAIRDGYKTLHELGAIDARRKLTGIGRQLSQLPVDPRIGRMILAADTEGCLEEVLIIASALEIQDPRQRPPGREGEADARQADLADDASDFLSLLKLWDAFHDWKQRLSRSRLRKACQHHFLSYNRMREWQEIHRQLRQLVQQNMAAGQPPLPRTSWKHVLPQDTGRRIPARRDDSPAIHRALLTGLLSNVAMRTERNEYQGTGGITFYLWPGSVAFSQKPKWVVAAELVETGKRYLRTVAPIDPAWIEPMAEHLVKRSYSDPFWSQKQGTALAQEKVTLFGLPVVVGRRKALRLIDPQTTRHLFIEHGLVEGQLRLRADFYRHNRQLLDELQTLGAKARKAGFLIPDRVQYAFYDERLPEEVVDVATLNGWLRDAPAEQTERLKMTRADLTHESDELPDAEFPTHRDIGGMQLEMHYQFEPGSTADGVTVEVPQEAVAQLDADQLQWLVPGLLQEKLVALIRSLPKSLRRALVPAPDMAKEAAEQLEFGRGRFLAAVAEVFSRLAGDRITEDDFRVEKLPPHLKMNVRVLDERKAVVAESRELDALRTRCSPDEPSTGVIDDTAWHRDEIVKWDFGELPEEVRVRRGNYDVPAYPALRDCGQYVSLRLLDSPHLAHAETRGGVRRLFVLAEGRELKSQVNWLPNLDQLKLYASTLRHRRDLQTQLIDLLAERAFLADRSVPRTPEAFEDARRQGRRQLPVAIQELAKLVPAVLQAHHQVQVALEQSQPAQSRHAVEDVRQQLAELMGDDFWTQTPWAWLGRYPRYLQAAAARLEKLRSGGQPRDSQSMELLEPHVTRWRQRAAEHAQQRIGDPELTEYRWMLEEFRVSLFAQHLGTQLKVSPQRLDKQWAKVHP